MVDEVVSWPAKRQTLYGEKLVGGSPLKGR